MANSDYSVDGLSKSQIKELQQSLGVKVDGLWGNKSQAALDAAYGKNADPYDVYSRGKNTGSSATHRSGYTGTVIEDKGRSYTDYGALLRDDDFFYPAGAKISPNGMYYDVGNGWQFAKLARQYDGAGNFRGYTTNSMMGAAPGSRVTGFEKVFSTRSHKTVNDNEPDADTEEPEQNSPSLWEQYFDEQLARHNEEHWAGYGL